MELAAKDGGNRMAKKALSFGIAALITLGTNRPLFAQDTALYLGGGVGSSKVNNVGSCSDIFETVTSCDDKTRVTSWRLFVGYQFSQYLAAEASYVDLGNFTISGTGTIPSIIAPPVEFTANASDKATGFSLDVVGTLPIRARFGLIGRVGFVAWTLDASADVAGGGVSRSTSEKPTGTSADFGAGVKYDFEKKVGARAEFQRFAKIGNDSTDKSDVDMISASIVYRFR